MKGVAFVIVLAGCSGCASMGTVTRSYDGQLVEGRYVPPDAYASYLRGVLAEESGDLVQARASFERAAKDDEKDATILARLGEVRCKADRTDHGADDAFHRALAIDHTSASALAASGRCALLRGRDEDAEKQGFLAVAADPTNADLAALLVRAQATRGDPATKARALSLTQAHGERAVAWDALIAWARGHHDAELLARGLVGLLHAAPARSAEVERGAKELLGEGQAEFARKVAVAVADSPRDLEVRGPRDPVVARLAIDEALARGDRVKAVARATRGHVDLAEVAARAAFLGWPSLAKELAEAVLAANPSASGADLVLAALASRPARPHADAPALCVLFYATTRSDSEAARFVAASRALPTTEGDPLGGVLVNLAERGAVLVTSMDDGLRVELAARRREAAPAVGPLDRRHELLRLSLADPDGQEARQLFAELSDSTDAVVTFAGARIALAEETRRASSRPTK